MLLQTEIENLVNVDKVVFTDIFDVQKPNTTAPFCAPGFTSINAGQADANHECLRVKVSKWNSNVSDAYLFGGHFKASSMPAMLLPQWARAPR